MVYAGGDSAGTCRRHTDGMKRLLLLSALMVITQPAMAAYQLLVPRAVDATLKCLETTLPSDCTAAQNALETLRDYSYKKGHESCGLVTELSLPEVLWLAKGYGDSYWPLTVEQKVEVIDELARMRRSCK